MFITVPKSGESGTGTNEAVLEPATPDALHVIVQRPFRAKHHVVVQCMARWMKCPLPPPPCWTPLPLPGPPYREDKEDKEESVTLRARDFALQLP